MSARLRRVRTPTINAIRSEWQLAAEQRLPPDSEVRPRNSAITATYAWLFRQRPHIFMWAGAAAFSSHRVGLTLVPYYADRLGAVGGVWQGLGELAIAGRRVWGGETLAADLDLIRRTNNHVYADITWAHLAYLDVHAGPDAVAEGLADLPSHTLLRDGFAGIARGERLLREGRRRRVEALDAIWHGNTLLLKHEQAVIVQPQFDQLQPGLRRFLSLMTWMDFDLESVLPFPTGFSNLKQLRALIAQMILSSDFYPDYTSFHVCMLTAGLRRLLQEGQWPEIRSFEQRWFWIDHDVMPTWRRVTMRDRTLARKMRRIMGGPLL